jgi:hypothetical protein
MAILDPKTRIFDSIITQEGRAQIASGKLKAEYYSFTDSGAIYQLDTIVSGGLDVTYRLCLEATNLPQDLVTLESDDTGRVFGTFAVSGAFANELIKIRDGYILSGGIDDRTAISASQFNSFASILITSQSFNNFKNLQILSSPDPLDENYNEFILGPKNINFIKKQTLLPLDDTGIKDASIDQIYSLFQDKRLSHLPNFQFLPPVNRAKIGFTTKNPLGNYQNLNQEPILSYDELQKEIDKAQSRGYLQNITFTETSRANNLFGQFFEVSEGQITKLDVIDFGDFPGTAQNSTRHVFFLGKIFTDSNGCTTFVNMFTMIFE